MNLLLILILTIQIEYCQITERRGKTIVEYSDRTEKVEGTGIKIVNDMSKEGWVLVSHSTANVPPYLYQYYVLKREK